MFDGVSYRRDELCHIDGESSEEETPESLEVIKPEKKKKKKIKFKNDLFIQPIKTDRDEIFKLEIQKCGTLPGPGVMLITGTTGSGKTVAICNILSKNRMLKGYYQEIYVFCLSPCPMLQDCLDLEPKHMIHEDDPELLVDIIHKQKKAIETQGFKKTKRILIILDDLAQSRSFLRHQVLQELAFASTHAKISVWITTQSYMQIPRNIRINAHYLMLFHGIKRSELERFSAEYESPFLTKREFHDMVKNALKEQYSFLFVNNTVPDKSIQFRKGFSTILKLRKV